ncbi:hypothetical protein [Butyrivibrio sp. JL13D10]|uniref:hypothetical protein n=1 Tax=Butyrivibrio sp. JL13D10 TaxID=3236815 RepID=UPI0038B509C4
MKKGLLVRQRIAGISMALVMAAGILSEAMPWTTIEVKADNNSNQGAVEVNIDKRENTPNISIKGLTQDIAWELATDEERTEINGGANGKLLLEITNIDSTVDSGEKKLMEKEAKLLNEGTAAMYLDFSMFFQIGQGNKRRITKLNGKSIEAAVTVPDRLLTTEKKRKFYLVSIHDGVVRIHGSTLSDTINAIIYDFSTYAIIYSDEEEEVLQTNITIKQTSKKIMINWDDMRDVGKVEVYVAYCGTKYTKKPTKTTRGKKVTVTSIRGKKIDQRRNYKMCLIAYDTSGNRIGKSLSLHFAGKNCKYTNPKKLKLSANRLDIKVGEIVKIRGKITYEDNKKKPLSEKHAKRFRYVSDFPEIASVDKNGNITGMGVGSCDVFVCCQNGLAREVYVNVTD